MVNSHVFLDNTFGQYKGKNYYVNQSPIFVQKTPEGIRSSSELNEPNLIGQVLQFSDGLHIHDTLELNLP